MASHSVDKIDVAALVMANDLATGRTVYLLESTADAGWSEAIGDAWRITNDEDAARAMHKAQASQTANQVIGPYLVNADSNGRPTHIREVLRAAGPSIAYGPRAAESRAA